MDEGRSLTELASQLGEMTELERNAIVAKLGSRANGQPAPEPDLAALAGEIRRLDDSGRRELLERLRTQSGATVVAPVVPELQSRLAGLTAQQRAAIVASLRRRAQRSESLTSLPGDPLSSAQEQLWFLDRLNPGSPYYNVSAVYRITGSLDVPAFAAALSAVADRHESLRTRYLEQGGIPYQVVDPPQRTPLRRSDLTDESKDELWSAIDAESNTPFDLATGPMWRNSLFRVAEDEWVYVTVIHHIAADGWSFDIIHEELGELYLASREGREPDFTETPQPYRIFARSQKERAEGGAFKSQLDYWTDKLRGPLPEVRFAPDRMPVGLPSNDGARAAFRMDDGTADLLSDVAGQFGVTPFVVSLAAFKAFMHRQTGREDIIIGVPTAGRNAATVQATVGYFVNTVALRTRLDGSMTFNEVVATVRQTVLESYDNLEVPYDHVVRALNPARDSARPPVFQVMFQHFDDSLEAPLQLEGAKVEQLTEDTTTAKFDLEIDVAKEGDALTADISYSTDLYDAATIKRILDSYQTFLRAVLRDFDRPIGDLDVMTDEDRALVAEFTGEPLPAPAELPLEFIMSQARAHPDSEALIGGEDNLTYRDLMGRVAAMRDALLAAGATRGTRVALLVAREVDAVVAMLAALSVGTAYIPIDPNLPAERIEWMLEDADPVAVIASDPTVSLAYSGPVLDLADLAGPPTAGEVSGVDVPCDAGPKDPAYIIYTSGTSGRPKGVVISHESLSALMVSCAAVYGFGPGERMLQFHSFSFDASVEEVFGSLGAGTALVLRSDDMLGSARRFMDAVDAAGISVLFLPTAFWHEIASEMLEANIEVPDRLRLVAPGGEAIAPELVAQWKERYDSCVALYNGYGPTEVTVDSVVTNLSAIDNPGTRSVVIGRPLPTVKALVLDDRQRPVPVGVPGELVLGGPQVAIGYLNRPELTEERFIPDPDGGAGRVYRTGDLVRWRSDGLIEFQGRLDRQVKINGYRIEPAEVEAAIISHRAVTEAAVVPVKLSGQQQLVAYAVAGDDVDVTEIVAHIRERLPAYMIPNRLELASELPRTAGGKVDVNKIKDVAPPGQEPDPPVAPRLTEAPLSFAQRRLWVAEQLDPGRATYIVPTALELSGALDVESLSRAVAFEVDRHQILRCRVVGGEDGPQLRADVDELALEVIDFRALSVGDARARATEFMEEKERTPMDLQAGPLVGFWLLRITDEESVVFALAHHIILDGESFGVLWDEVAEAYAAFAGGAEPSPAGPESQYLDYAVWQRDRLESGAYAPDIAYWKTQLTPPVPVLELPVDRRSASIVSSNAGDHDVTVSRETWSALVAAAASVGATPYMALVAGMAGWLHRLGGGGDLAIGMPATERQTAATEVGLYVNTLPLRFHLGAKPSYLDLVIQARDAVLGGLEHRQAPFEVVLENCEIERVGNRSPVFQVVCALAESTSMPDFPGLEVAELDDDEGLTASAKFEITLYGLPEEDGSLDLSLEYNADLFLASSMERYGAAFAQLLDEAAANPRQPVTELEVLDDRTRRWLTEEMNATDRPYPETKRIPEIFWEVAERNAKRTAIIDGDTQLSYKDLGREVGTLVKSLKRSGIRPGDAVGIAMERSSQLVVAMLATLDAGASYVPLDPSYPQERLDYMRSNAQLRAIVEYHEGDYTIDVVGDGRPQFAEPAPAYIMYTSGSTGRPKGVVVPHQAILRLVLNNIYAALGPSAVVAHASNTAFDAATFEVWGAMLNGGTLAVLDPNTAGSPTALSEALPRLGVTTMFVTTALFNAIARERPDAFSTLDDLLFGGEAADVNAVRRVLAASPPRNLMNVYGPTETTTFASFYPIAALADDATSVPIGRPIGNTSLHVLDANGNLVPPGVSGELYIGGDGLAEGYLGDPGLTSARFVPDPFSEDGASRLYRTGDVVRRNSDGVVEFIGRADRQVKLRGFRVEPGEIEVKLRSHPAVSEAIVRVWERHDDARLIAYVVPEAGEQITVLAIYEFLRGAMPGHMIPGHVEVIDSLPMNANGKVDTAALPVPELRSSPAYVAPSGSIAIKIAQMWSRVLKVERVGLTDNFFDLGGHSILAVELMAAVERELGRHVPLSFLFDAPSLGEFVALLDGEEPAQEKGLSKLVVPIRPGGLRRPLFCFHPGGGNVFAYEPLSKHLDEDQPVIGIQAKGSDGLDRPHRTIEDMAAEYVGIIKTVQPDGPYRLLGYSLGGVIAFETAQQLRRAGDDVDMLALLDSYFPTGETRWDEFRAEMSELMAEGLPGIRESVHELWLSLRELLGKLRHGPRWTYYRLRRKAVPPMLAGKQLTHIGLEAYRLYTPESYGGNILFFRATGQDGDSPERPDIPWNDIADVERVDVIGRHVGAGSIVEEPQVSLLGAELNWRLRESAD